MTDFVKKDSEEHDESDQPTVSSDNKKVSINEYLEMLNSGKVKLVDETRPDNTSKPTSTSTSTSPTIKEINQVMAVHKKAKNITEQILVDAKMGKIVDTGTVKDLVSELVEHCIKSPEAFVNMTRLKDYDSYTFTHSVNVSVISISIARRLGSSAQDMKNIGFAGLMHDIGKMWVPEEILNKPGKLTDEEFEIIKMHPVRSYEYLRDYSEGIPEDILSAVRSHHEKSDGSGYPDGIIEKYIPRFAKIISIADVYDAITSEKVYNKGIVPSNALKMIFSWSGKHFNDALVKFFISAIGIYPVSTLVMLNTNELAVILEPNKKEPMRPRVLIISNRRLELTKPSFFDLTSYNIATRIPYKSIVSALDPRDFNVNPNQIIEQYIGG
ncbi:MAG: HD-GYP domain-containing protein [Deferribacteraceae bacterium]|jgi:putative nucleotidyltransferase with HDIG domain|nr:HD-GYP domain-containing protein [Deferribacteraceae bacterium]